ncbi:DUF3450 domain-containing protein [Myxococcota bacterium]|nr:DUF3450 domain-containing protein [Myxococcota bacterium]MBU1429251.1 DUF3450 domain-containing protein [Myxococcota bacterium]MBU1897313.1 DUF3450 domain-containing protein [Myxococcota bacterium]
MPTCLLALALLAPSPPAPPPDLPTMARALADLRVEIDELDAQLRVEKTQINAALRGLEARVAELEMRLDAERVRRARLQAQIDRHQAEADAQTQTRAAASEAILRGLDAAQALVEEGLPFRRAARLKALDGLRARLKEGRVDPHALGVELWRFMEDERRLRREVEMSEIPIQIEPDAAPRLLRVVRLGMVTLYTRLDEARFGQLRREGAGWRHVEIEPPQQRQQLASLFQSLRRQVREGAWRLPLEAPNAR